MTTTTTTIIPLQKPPASARIPPLARPYVSDRALAMLDAAERFVEEECIPADPVYLRQLGRTTGERFSDLAISSRSGGGNDENQDAQRSIMQDLKEKARELGLWNLFLPGAEGAGFSNVEYGLMAELLGKCRTASEATNCSAPDTGNMEVLTKYGTEMQKRQWLDPLLRGEIRSAFLMTEPDVASSDATNIQLSMRREGDEWVLNGSKWWSSGAGDPRCEVYIVMGKSNPNDSNPYRQQSVILVPAHTPGITLKRMLSVFGYDDAPHGHGHITLENVRVPAANLILGEGRGFEVVQGRLGPGRIHHAMRCIGAAERALEYFIARATNDERKPFGKTLSEHGVMLTRIAQSRIDIDAARLVVLNAAVNLDLQAQQQHHRSPFSSPSTSKHTSTQSITAIASAKLLSAHTALRTIDAAIQAHGGAGVSQDTPLAAMWAQARTMRIVDGPDEVHLLQVGRREVKSKSKSKTKTRTTEPEAHQTRTRTRTRTSPGHTTTKGTRKATSETQSARLMGAEKDGAASTSASEPVHGDARTGIVDETIYDVNLKIEAQRRKSIELAKLKKYNRYNNNNNNNNTDLSRDELDVEALKSEEMEMKRRRETDKRMAAGKAKL